MIQGTEINARKAAVLSGSASLANYGFPQILFTKGSALLMWNLGYPAMSRAHVVGVQTCKILDYGSRELHLPCRSWPALGEPPSASQVCVCITALVRALRPH